MNNTLLLFPPIYFCYAYIFIHTYIYIVVAASPSRYHASSISSSTSDILQTPKKYSRKSSIQQSSESPTPTPMNTPDDKFQAAMSLAEAVEGKRPVIDTLSAFYKHKIKLLNVIKKWIRSHPQDFTEGQDGPKAYLRMTTCLDNYPPKEWNSRNHPKAQKIIQSLSRIAKAVVETLKKVRKTFVPRAPPSPPPAAPNKSPRKSVWRFSNRRKYVSIKDILDTQSEKNIAKALTLLSIRRLSEAKARDFIGGGTGGGGQIAISSRISDWVSTEVLVSDTYNDMLRVLKTWITVAHECLKHRNFGSTFEIIYGLTRHTVARLTSCFNGLPTATLDQFDKLKAFISPSENFKQYRKAVLEAKEACLSYIPYFGCMTRDIFSLENANPRLTINVSCRGEKNIETLLHVKRCGLIFKTINDTLKCKHMDWKVKEESKIIKLVKKIELASYQMVASERQLEQLSQRIRPRHSTPRDLEIQSKKHLLVHLTHGGLC